MTTSDMSSKYIIQRKLGKDTQVHFYLVFQGILMLQQDLVVQLNPLVRHLLFVHLVLVIQEYLDSLLDLAFQLVQGFLLHPDLLVVRDPPAAQGHRWYLEAQQGQANQQVLVNPESLSVLEFLAYQYFLLVLKVPQHQCRLLHQLDLLNQEFQQVLCHLVAQRVLEVQDHLK